MSARRLEPPGVDARASVSLDAHEIDSIARGTIHRRRMSTVGKKRTSDAASADQAGDTSLFSIATGETQASKSIDEILAEFVRPNIADPGILKRSVTIMQTFVDEMIPHLDGGDQLKNLARTLMGEEIEKRRELLARMQETLT